MAVGVLAHALPRRQLSLMFGNPAMRSPPRDGVVALRVKTASSGTLAPHAVSDGRLSFTVGNWRGRAHPDTGRGLARHGDPRHGVGVRLALIERGVLVRRAG